MLERSEVGLERLEVAVRPVEIASSTPAAVTTVAALLAPNDDAPGICEPGGSGLLLPLSDWETNLPYALRAVVYGCVLLWCFVGVAIVADIFMNAIERITSAERKVMYEVRGNPTVRSARSASMLPLRTEC